MTPAQAWSAVVAGEDAAVYAYSVAGARLPSGGRRRALAGLDAHRSNRSRAAALVSAAGAQPPPAQPAYSLPDDVADPAAARALLARVDTALVAVYADAAAVSGGADRLWAARTAAECASSAVAWGAEPQAFPSVAG